MDARKSVALHTLVAVRPTLETTLKTISAETDNSFRKPESLTEWEKTFTSTVTWPEGSEALKVALESQRSGHRAAVTSTQDRIGYEAAEQVKYWDLMHNIELGNQVAVADVVLKDGTVLMTRVPATHLRRLDTWLTTFRNRIANCPTVPSTINVEQASRNGRMVYAGPVKTITVYEETKSWVKVAEANVHQKEATVREAVTKTPIGIEKEINYYGMPTSSEKAQLLTRLDELIVAVKEAITESNTVTIEPVSVSKTLMAYAFTGKVNA